MTSDALMATEGQNAKSDCSRPPSVGLRHSLSCDTDVGTLDGTHSQRGTIRVTQGVDRQIETAAAQRQRGKVNTSQCEMVGLP